MQDNPLRAIGTGACSIAGFVEEMLYNSGKGTSKLFPYQHMTIDSISTLNEEPEQVSMNEKKARYRKGINSFLNKGKRYRNV